MFAFGRKRDYLKKDNPLKRMETKNDTETDQLPHVEAILVESWDKVQQKLEEKVFRILQS